MLIKIRPLYKVRMRQDQAHTRAHDTYGTITQHLSTFEKFHLPLLFELLMLFLHQVQGIKGFRNVKQAACLVCRKP